MKICSFCHQDMPHCPLKILEKRQYQVYFCQTCSAEFLFFKNTLKSISLYTNYQNKLYRWTTQADKSSAQLRQYKEPGIPGVKPNRGSVLLYSMVKERGDFIPDLFPHNLQDKIKNWLMFI